MFFLSGRIDRPTNREGLVQMTTTTHTFTTSPRQASEKGALNGWAMACTCGTVQVTSLSQRQSERDGFAHIDWHAKTGR